MKYQCPVCLVHSLDEPYQHYSYDICNICGVEYGYDDAVDESGLKSREDWLAKADDLLSESHKKLRKIWVDAGRPNWAEETERPDFTYGVRWYREYWEKHPLEKEEWQQNLLSAFDNLVERPKNT